MRRRTRRFWPWLVALLLLMALSFWLGRSPSRGPRRASSAPTVEPAQDSTKGRRAPRLPRCKPAAGARCFEGDVWTIDGCGELEELREECAGRGCRDARCLVPSAPPCTDPPTGRCDGDRVRLCLGGHSRIIDCAARGRTCAQRAEGAECIAEVPRGERCRGPARCEGDVLVRCEEGRRHPIDCSEERAVCARLDGAEAACVVLDPPPLSPCGPCGCDASGQGEARCDGRDDDGNGLVDEGLDCGPVPIVAFVGRVRGVASHDDEDVQAEIERVNALLARDRERAPFTFALDAVSYVDELGAPLTEQDFGRLAGSGRLAPARPSFYVPVLFVERIESEGGVPRLGISTLPNGTCGGVHWGSSPELGLVAVARERAPSTLAHELGHFLGLCHTHETRATAPVVAVTGPRGSEACAAPCEREGDGICDTPTDPGPEGCTYDSACRTACASADEPDPANLMSYYTECRALFTPEQVTVMQHTLALRRGWQRCLGGACGCQLGGPAACPVDMGCRPLARGGAACTLDGPRAPGADCEAADQCGAGAVCLEETGRGLRRCVRPCASSGPGCTCSSTEGGLDLCLEDLR